MMLGAADVKRDDGGTMMLELSLVIAVTEVNVLDGGSTMGCAEVGYEWGVMDLGVPGC